MFPTASQYEKFKQLPLWHIVLRCPHYLQVQSPPICIHTTAKGLCRSPSQAQNFGAKTANQPLRWLKRATKNWISISLSKYSTQTYCCCQPSWWQPLPKSHKITVMVMPSKIQKGQQKLTNPELVSIFKLNMLWAMLDWSLHHKLKKKPDTTQSITPNQSLKWNSSHIDISYSQFNFVFSVDVILTFWGDSRHVNFVIINIRMKTCFTKVIPLWQSWEGLYSVKQQFRGFINYFKNVTIETIAVEVRLLVAFNLVKLICSFSLWRYIL